MALTEKFSDLLDTNLSDNKINTNEIIQGIIVSISSDFVVVDINRKSEALIPKAEFCDAKGQLNVAVGDQTEVALDGSEDQFGYGETPLSHIKAKRAATWQMLEQAYENNEAVTGLVLESVKGGFTVALDAVRAFLPGSLIDVRPVRDTSYLLDKEWKFKIVKMDKRRNNIVVSRKAVVEGESQVDRDNLLATLSEGKVLEGIVKNLTEYGAFVDLGGIDGLLHITDMSWKRIKHPNQLLTVGDKIEVIVLKFDIEKQRVSLGMKQLTEDPLISVIRQHPIGSRLVGKVTNVADYGCFVEIGEGIEGLVHMSEMDWTNKNIHPSKLVQPGDEVEVLVLEVDEKRRRISLGLKQCTPNPWEMFEQTHKRGDKLKGKIKSLTDFGIFIGLEGDIDGLLHLSDISAKEQPEKALRDYKKGDEIEVCVLSIDAERERISLGIKQLKEFGYDVDEEEETGTGTEATDETQEEVNESEDSGQENEDDKDSDKDDS